MKTAGKTMKKQGTQPRTKKKNAQKKSQLNFAPLKKKHEKPSLMVDLFIWLRGAQRRKGSGVFETRETREFPITVTVDEQLG
jgi:hypothetical protein